MKHASNSNAPLITVAIPTCNRPDLLARAIRSVQANSFQNWEMCISDDGSPKLGREFIAWFQDSRIRYHPHERMVIEDNWTAACLMGTAPYIFKLDDDDTIEPEFLELTVAFLENNPDVSVVYTGFSLVIGDKTEPVVRGDFFTNRQSVDGLEYVRAILLNEGYPSNHKSAGVFRRTKAEAIEWFKYARMDVTFSMALAVGSRVGYLPKFLFNYHRRAPGTKLVGEGMKPEVYESVLRDFVGFFSWPFVASNPDLRAIESIAKSRIQFTVPLMYLFFQRDSLKVILEKWRITKRLVHVRRRWLLWILCAAVLLARLLPLSWLNRLYDWYARTGWIKKALNVWLPR